MADDSEQELLLESRESRESDNNINSGKVDEGLIVQLSKRDSSSVITRPRKKARSTDTEVRSPIAILFITPHTCAYAARISKYMTPGKFPHNSLLLQRYKS